MDASVLRSFRSLLAAMAFWMAACAIAGSIEPVVNPKTPPNTAGASTVTWLRSATDDFDVHLQAARLIPEDAASPNLRIAAASSWSLGMKDAGADKAPARSGTTASPATEQPGLWAFLGSAQMPIGWAFVLASIGLMSAIARRRQFD